MRKNMKLKTVNSFRIGVIGANTNLQVNSWGNFFERLTSNFDIGINALTVLR